MGEFLFLVVALVLMCWFFWIMVVGFFRAFERNFLLALFLLIFISPIFFIWAFIEGISG